MFEVLMILLTGAVSLLIGFLFGMRYSRQTFSGILAQYEKEHMFWYKLYTELKRDSET